VVETVPHAVPEQPAPATLQVTPVIVVPVTLAANCCPCPAAICAEVGEMLTAICWTIVAVAVLDFVESATEVAVMKTNEGDGGVDGAV
jgi:hypothetical protein